MFYFEAGRAVDSSPSLSLPSLQCLVRKYFVKSLAISVGGGLLVTSVPLCSCRFPVFDMCSHYMLPYSMMHLFVNFILPITLLQLK